MMNNTKIPIRIIRTIAVFSCFLSFSLACGSRQNQETIEDQQSVPTSGQNDTYHNQLQTNLRDNGVDPDSLSCNTQVTWASTLFDEASQMSNQAEELVAQHFTSDMTDEQREQVREELRDLAMNWFIRTLLIHGNYNNLGAVIIPSVTWTDESGQQHPLIVFHSATTPFAEEQNSCFRSLLREGRVRHAVNLYDGEVPLRDLIDAESRVAQELGAQYTDISQDESDYAGWRHIAGDENSTAEQRRAASEVIARLLREQILEPNGAPPQGNAYFHCAGGMHRSTLLSGVLRKCIVGESMERIVETMRVHSAYENEENEGGYEQPIADFVSEFDCSLFGELASSP